MKKRSLENILSDVTRIAVEYYELTGKPLGVTGEVAECMAAAKLDLVLAPARSSGFDAYRTVDRHRQKIQIKGRWKKHGSSWGRVSSIDITKDFDSVMLVLMRGPYDLFEIWEASRAAVIDRLTVPGSKARNERGSMGVSQFKSIGTRVWPAG